MSTFSFFSLPLATMMEALERKKQTSKTCQQAERLFAIEQHCKTNPELQDIIMDPRSELDPYRKFVVDEKHKIVLCQVPKAAGSYWRTMFVKGTGKLDEDEEDEFNVHRQDQLKSIGLNFLHQYPIPEQERILNTFLKVMTVRHPLARAVSAYVDKFVSSRLREPIIRCIDHINKHFRSKDNQIELTDGEDTIPSGVTIQDFVNLVLDPTSPYNPHWDMAFHLCHPCVIAYDYVIRTETISEDAQYILDILSQGLDTPLELEIVHTRTNNSVDDVLEPTFHKVIEDFHKIPQEQLNKLKQIYRHDLEVFGYDFSVDSKEALCSYDQHVKDLCC